jgi:hypothetical protein
MNSIDPKVALTPTVARQTPKGEFGEALKTALRSGGTLASGLAGVVPGGGLVTAALGAAGSGSASALAGVTSASATVAPGATGTEGAGSLQGELAQMKAQADQSLALQIAMQNESREYATLSNVIKVRHDSARSAINNIH